MTKVLLKFFEIKKTKCWKVKISNLNNYLTICFRNGKGTMIVRICFDLSPLQWGIQFAFGEGSDDNIENTNFMH